jgi:alpha-ketoglutarate-dependent taurine dioxygenase
MELRPLDPRFGFLLRAAPGEHLGRVDAATLRELLEAGGAVLLRGFAPDAETLGAFAAAFGEAHDAHLGGPVDRDVVIPAGQPGGPLRTVTYGRFGMNPHTEAGYSPMCPDLIWFLCERPAAGGGRTILCDGADLLDALDADTRAAFEACTIGWWLSPRRDEMEGHLGLTLDEIARRWFDPDPDCSWSVEGDRVVLHHRVPAVRRSRLSGRTAFANSLLGLFAYKDAGLRCMPMPDVGGLPDEALAQAMSLAHARALPVDWEAGDVLVLENTRVLHGREPFADPHRRILVQTMTVHPG